MGAQAPRQVRRVSGTLMAAAAAALVSCASLPPNSTTIPPASTVTSSPVPSDPSTPIPTPTESPSPTPTPQPALGQTSHDPPLPSGAGELVPILYMHRVVPADIGTWTSDAQRAFLPYMITPREVSAQLDWLAANGYTTILPRDLVADWDQGVALPPKPVILTFDDGSADWSSWLAPPPKRWRRCNTR